MTLGSCLPVLWLVVLAEVLGCGAPAVSASPPEGGTDGGLLPDVGPFDAGTFDAPKVLLDASCSPGSLTSFTPAYNLPVGPYKGMCSAYQLAKAVSLCFGPMAKRGTDCDGFVNDPENAACVACALGPWTGSTWPPILYADTGAELFPDIGGCIALADPSQLTCAEAFEYGTECELTACQAACPIPTSTNSPFESCVKEADGDAGPCASYAQKVTSCEAALQSDAGTSPATFCLGMLSTESSVVADAVTRYLALACGAGPVVDAGSPPPPMEGGSVHDAH
jgi:hypothetical protein